jgi:(S)-ureidoglycine-glyoxylate aminotransferase
MSTDPAALFDELNPAPRLLMGPGPVNADPRVLRAMSMPLLGQFDPQFTAYMNETMALLRQLFQTRNHWSFLVDGSARAGIEALLVSLIEPGDRVLVPIFGRFGYLLQEIASRCGADVRTVETEWGSVFPPDAIEGEVKRLRPKLVAVVHGDTSTSMAQPLADIGAICRRYDCLLCVDATATLGGADLPVDVWHVDAASAGLQKCLSGPPGSAPITFSERVADLVRRRRHIEAGIRPAGVPPPAGARIGSNYFDLAMLMDYWSEARLNHHTEATSMLYAARECVRIVLSEGLPEAFARHAAASRALTAGLTAMDLKLFGDQRHKMPNVTAVRIPDGIDGEKVRSAMLHDFGIEIGTSFGPLHGRVWRIGTMGYNCRKANVLICLGALEAVLRRAGFTLPSGAGIDAAYAAYGTS